MMTEKQEAELVRRAKAGESSKALAERFGVTRRRVNQIRTANHLGNRNHA